MGIVGILLMVLFAVACLLIIFLVLIQDEQGEGLGGLFGGGSSTPFSATGGNVLTKATSFLGIVFMLVSIFVAFFMRSPSDDGTLGEARRQQGEGINWFEEEVQSEESETEPLLP